MEAKNSEMKETATQRKRRLEKKRLNRLKKVANETPEARLQRLEIERIRQARKRERYRLHHELARTLETAVEIGSDNDREDDDYDPAEDDSDPDYGKAKKKKAKRKSVKAKPVKILQVVEEIPIEFDFSSAGDDGDGDNKTSSGPDKTTEEVQQQQQPPRKRPRKMTTPQRSRNLEIQKIQSQVMPANQAGGSGGHKTDNGERDPLSLTDSAPKYAPPPTINRYPCGYCDTVFTDMSFLERHHKRCKAKRAAESVGVARPPPVTQSPPKPTATTAAVTNLTGVRQTYTCDKCTFTTKNPEHLKYHKPIHNDSDRFFSCEECKFTCRDLDQLNTHKKIHSGYKEYTYVQEAATAPDSEQDSKHVENDTEANDGNAEQLSNETGENSEPEHEKTYTCDQCSYTSTRPGYLVMHKRIHVREKPYVCQDCGYKCARLAYFKKHRATHVNAEEECLSCDRCSFTTSSQNVLEAHKQCHKA